jgi:hypothetical protein
VLGKKSMAKPFDFCYAKPDKPKKSATSPLLIFEFNEE